MAFEEKKRSALKKNPKEKRCALKKRMRFRRKKMRFRILNKKIKH